MKKPFNPTIQIGVSQMMGVAPGDPCPDMECSGVITEISFKLTSDFFGGDAKCSNCGECWCLAEECEHPMVMNDKQLSELVDELVESTINGNRKYVVGEILAKPTAEAALLAARVAVSLTSKGESNHVIALLKIIRMHTS